MPVDSRICRGQRVAASRLKQAMWEADSDALKDLDLLAKQDRKHLKEAGAANDPGLESKKISLAFKRVAFPEDRMTDSYRGGAIDLDRFKTGIGKLRRQLESLQRQFEDLDQRRAAQASSESGLKNLERF